MPQLTALQQDAEPLLTNWPPVLPPPRFFDDLKAPDFEMPEVLIDGLVHRGGKILISAPSKARKTWALINLLLSVQAGCEWWGFRTVRTKVLLIDCELFQAAAYNRCKTVANAARIADTSGLAIQSLRGQRLNLDRIKESTISFCREHEIGLIGIDPYYRIAAGQDENANHEIALFLEGIEEIAHETGAAIALTHHYAKGNAAAKSSIDRMSGAGVFARDPDALIAMTEAECSDDENPVFIIEPTVREFKPVPAFGIRWEFPLWKRDDSIATTLKGSGEAGRPPESTVADILALLPADEEISTGEWQRLCYTEGIQRSSFYKLKSKAEDQGYLESRKDGRQVLWKRKREEPSQTDLSL